MCRDVHCGKKQFQTLLVNSTIVNDLLLGLLWFISVGARMTVTSRGLSARVVVIVICEDGSEALVTIQCEPMRTKKKPSVDVVSDGEENGDDSDDGNGERIVK